MTTDVSERLADLARKYNTDKGPADIKRSTHRGDETLTGKAYTRTYARFFATLQDEPITLLEIGVDKGASVRLWEDFFARAEIHGIDISPGCRKHASDRVSIHIGSQTDQAFLNGVVEKTGPLDIVIDDGGHTMEQHEISLRALWPHLKPGGYYAVEDTHTCYWSRFGGGGVESTIERFKSLIDTVNGSSSASEPIVEQVEGIWFAKSIAVLLKAGAEETDGDRLPV